MRVKTTHVQRVKYRMTSNLQRRHDQLLKEIESLKTIQKQAQEGKKRMSKVAKMLVAPGESFVTPSPCMFPARAATRHFTRTYTITNPAATADFGVQLTPSISEFLSIQSGSVVVPIPTDLKISVDLINGERAGIGSYYDYNAGTSALDLLGSSRKAAASDGFVKMEWTTTSTGTLTYVYVTNPTSRIIRVCIRAYHTGGTTDQWRQLQPNETQTSNITAGVNTWLGIGFAADTGSGTPPINACFVVIDNNAVSFVANSLTRGIVKDSLVEAGQVDRYRVTAMSVLASYRGNLLENAGVIASCRVPTRWIPSGGTMYESICKLPEDSYRGPLINGAYAWWLPNDLSELDMRYPGSDVETTSLFVGGSFSDAGSAIELRVDIVVEFYSPLQIFERNLLPMWDEHYYSLLSELAHLPAATCNPSHLEILKSGAKKAFALGKRAYDFGQANPEIVSLFLKGLSALAL